MPPSIICLFLGNIYELELTLAPTTTFDDVSLQLTPSELLGVMDSLPHSVGHAVTSDPIDRLHMKMMQRYCNRRLQLCIISKE